MSSHRKYIETLAQQALEKIECNGAPVPVEEVAKKFGLEVVEFPFHDKLSGLLKKEQGIIGVNKSHHPMRRRFTIAHELGHFLLGHGMETPQDEVIDETFDKPLPQEREANMFASYLLMPAEWVKTEWKKAQKDEEGMALEVLAKTFGVSKQAITIRLMDLKIL